MRFVVTWGQTVMTVGRLKGPLYQNGGCVFIMLAVITSLMLCSHRPSSAWLVLGLLGLRQRAVLERPAISQREEVLCQTRMHAAHSMHARLLMHGREKEKKEHVHMLCRSIHSSPHL